jgi:3D (Asp-Asp-Asp) domain-containing protein
MKGTFHASPTILVLGFLLLVSALLLVSSLSEVDLRGQDQGEIQEVLPFGRSASPAERPRYESFQATAYNIFGRTFSGVPVNTGVAAADPEILPIGSVIHVKAGKYTGVYTVLDTGPAVRGRTLDLFIPDSQAARQFGRRRVQVRVLRHGWKSTMPTHTGWGAAG